MDASVGTPRAAGAVPASTPASSKRPPRAPLAPWHAAILLILCWAIAILPGLFALPPIDRDESRFAQASRQMFEAAAWPTSSLDTRVDSAGRPIGPHAGGWAVPMVGERPRLNKPPLIYWLQVASAWICSAGDPARDAIWMYRLPSALAALASAFVVFVLARSMLSRAGGLDSFPHAPLVAAASLLLCPLVVIDAHMARADQLLLLCTTAAMACLWRVWLASLHSAPPALASPPASTHALAPSLRPPLLAVVGFWLALTAGVLTKGPITPMVAAAAILALCVWSRSWRWLPTLRPLLGIAIVLAACSPWLWALHQQFGLGAYARLVWDEFFVRAAAGSREGHFAPPGYHTLLSAVLFWPGSLVTLAALITAWRSAFAPITTPAPPPPPPPPPRPLLHRLLAAPFARAPAPGPALFLLAWIIPAWILFELSPAKLAHYPLPLYPALAILSAWALYTLPRSRAGELIWLFIALAVLSVPLALAISAGAGPAIITAARESALLLVALVLLAIIALRPGGSTTPRALLAVALLAITLAWPRVTTAIASRDSLFTASRIAAAIDAAGLTTAPIAAAGFQEDSLVFLTRGRLQRLAEPDALAWARNNPGGILILTPVQLERLSTPPDGSAAPRPPAFSPIARFTGFNYANGSSVAAIVLHIKAADRAAPDAPPAEAAP